MSGFELAVLAYAVVALIHERVTARYIRLLKARIAQLEKDGKP